MRLSVGRFCRILNDEIIDMGPGVQLCKYGMYRSTAVTRQKPGLINRSGLTGFIIIEIFVQNRMLIVEKYLKNCDLTVSSLCLGLYHHPAQRKCAGYHEKKPSEASHSSRPHRRAAKGEGGTWGSTSTTSNRESILSDYENHRPEDRSEIQEQAIPGKVSFVTHPLLVSLASAKKSAMLKLESINRTAAGQAPKKHKEGEHSLNCLTRTPISSPEAIVSSQYRPLTNSFVELIAGTHDGLHTDSFLWPTCRNYASC
ncbi:hypothetical protein CCUS01_11948 [Colletotrichum cuscutae]|uniref:Uncharacterized protein n=1 Tax=Colletotrichum cuscutae TaxID=1209917 RepID=A0AAI9XFX2_9PEZI|nr:hypothetical protein CCUS01_11948 [Colletotrichum cuscutae]